VSFHNQQNKKDISYQRSPSWLQLVEKNC